MGVIIRVVVGVVPTSVHSLVVAVDGISVKEIHVITFGRHSHGTDVTCLVVPAACHHLAGEIVRPVDDKSISDGGQTAPAAGFPVECRTDVRHRESGETLASLIGEVVNSSDRVGTVGGVHRTEREIRRDRELGVPRHGRSRRIDSD